MMNQYKNIFYFAPFLLTFLCMSQNIISAPQQANNSPSLSQTQQSKYILSTPLTEAQIAYNHSRLIQLFTKAKQFEEQDNPDMALDVYRSLLVIDPKNIKTMKKMIVNHILLNEMELAIPLIKRLIPLRQSSEMFLCMAYLSLERYEHIINRWKTLRVITPTLKKKKILITRGWGLGDHFMFIRYAALLKEAGAYVIAQVKNPVIPLFSLCPYIDEVVSIKEPKPEADITISYETLMRLTYPVSKTIIAQNIPYLNADPKLVTFWKEKLEQEELTRTQGERPLRVGLCWNSSIGECDRENRLHTRRTIPLKDFEPLASIPGVSFYSLQQVTGLDQLGTISDTFIIHTFDDSFDKKNGAFMDTAAVMEGFLDLIISVDTSTPHLSGALGKPTWVLLPFSADWRWPITRTHDTPWYPTMRLFKQKTAGQWTDVIEDVASALAELAAQRRS